jgi:cytochrome b561
MGHGNQEGTNYPLEIDSKRNQRCRHVLFSIVLSEKEVLKFIIDNIFVNSKHARIRSFLNAFMEKDVENTAFQRVATVNHPLSAESLIFLFRVHSALAMAMVKAANQRQTFRRLLGPGLR